MKDSRRKRGMLKRLLAPAAPSLSGDCEREEVGDWEGVPSPSSCSLSPSDVGYNGRVWFGGVWKGKSVGDRYPWPVEGSVLSGSSMIGVIGGGGVLGSPVCDDMGAPLSGEEATGIDDAESVLFGLRER